MTKQAPPGRSEPAQRTDRSELFRNLALLVFPAYALIALLLFFWPQTTAPPEDPQRAERIARLQQALEEQMAVNARQARQLDVLREELRAARATPAPDEATDATPAPTRTPAPAPTASPPPSPTPEQATGTEAAAPSVPQYTVQPGETLGAIAKAQCGSAREWREILAANAGQLEKAEDLRAGMVLAIPCAAE